MITIKLSITLLRYLCEEHNNTYSRQKRFATHLSLGCTLCTGLIALQTEEGGRFCSCNLLWVEVEEERFSMVHGISLVFIPFHPRVPPAASERLEGLWHVMLAKLNIDEGLIQVIEKFFNSSTSAVLMNK